MPLTLRKTLVTALLLAVGMVGLDTETASPAAVSPPSTRAVVGPVPVPLQQYRIPPLAVTPLPDSPDDEPGYRFLGSAGGRLYAERDLDERATHIVRYNPETGAIEAEYPYRELPDGTPWNPGGAWAFHPDGVVVLDGDRKTVAILDSDTLAVRKRVRLPKNTRSELSSNHESPGPVWLGHRSYDEDSFRGRYTRRATTHIDVKRAKAKRTIDLPACGTKGGVQPRPTQIVVPLECSYQLGIIDLRTGKLRSLPAFQTRAEVALVGDDVWVRWNDLGYLAKLDTTKGRLTTLDLNAGGPPIRSLYGFVAGAGSVWAVGTPVEESPVRVLYRVDPKTVTVTGRAWTTGGVAFLGETGYMGYQGHLSTFDPAAVTRAAPTEVVRPDVQAAQPHKPRNAAERAVMASFARVFNYKVSNQKAAPYLENAEQLADVRTKLTTLARTLYESLRLSVTEVTVTGDQAALAYTFLLNGAPAFVPLTASLSKQDGKWIVSEDSVCQLAVTAGVATC